MCLTSFSVLHLDGGQRESSIEMSEYVDNLLMSFIWEKVDVLVHPYVQGDSLSLEEGEERVSQAGLE